LGSEDGVAEAQADQAIAAQTDPASGVQPTAAPAADPGVAPTPVAAAAADDELDETVRTNRDAQFPEFLKRSDDAASVDRAPIDPVEVAAAERSIASRLGLSATHDDQTDVGPVR
ncbi:MAG: hypothetical protein J0H64_04670, partial [Actinobacteria bacterium]|nr:hypothetical protein [Actinomycetota bacterium]